MSELKSQGKNKISIPSVDIPDIDSLYKNEKDESKERFKSTLLYVPEGRKKLNKDLVKRQYFHNFIAPDPDAMKKFDKNSLDDERFQDKIDVLLEKEIQTRQNTFNPMEYLKKNKLPPINNEMAESTSNMPSYNTLNIPPPIITPDKPAPLSKSTMKDKPMDYAPIQSRSMMQNMNMMPASNTLDYTHIGVQKISMIGGLNSRKQYKTPIITYNNKFFTEDEKHQICINHFSQDDFDPFMMLSKESFTIRSLQQQYINLLNLYQPGHYLRERISKALQYIDQVITKTMK